MSLTAVIVDDEPLARQELQYLLEDAGDITVVAQASNGIEAVDILRTHKPDVVFLDVQMPGLDGFAVLKKLMAAKVSLPQVVFATAFDQYAVRAFEVNAVDYLLKPFDRRRVQRAVARVRSLKMEDDLATEEPSEPRAVAPTAPSAPRLVPAEDSDVDVQIPTPPHSAEPSLTERAGALLSTLSAQTEAKLDALLRMLSEPAVDGARPSITRPSGKIVVRAQNRLLLVDQREICFASIEDGAISVVTPTVEGLSNCRTLEELMEQFDPETFWRAHRSYVVNIQHIREVVPWFKSSYQLRMDDRKHTEIPVSRSQTRRLRELFNL